MANKIIERIPVFVISGFLGSGKTTLLNRLLAYKPKSAVIINEFGATPIDQCLLRQHNAPLSTLSGGCLCCQVRGSLTPVLKNLRMASDSGSSAFERVIIETSGAANPGPVLDTLLRQKWLAERYSLQGIITTVSAAMDGGYFDSFPEAKAQVAWADHVVVTQADLASAEALAKLEQRLSVLAPAANRLSAVRGELDFDVLLEAPKRFRRLPDEAVATGHEFNSISLRFERPLSWEQLENALMQLMASYPGRVLRIKGVVYVLGQSEPLLVQGAAGRLYPAVKLPISPADDGAGRLVIITLGEIKELAGNLLSRLS
ncbi:MAG: CobW family GTP-binding protein [Methylobacter sp.]